MIKKQIRKARKRLRILITFIAILVVVLFAAYKFIFAEKPQMPEGVAEFHCIDVGQGDSTLILADDMTVLIDTGENDPANVVIDYLKELEIAVIDYFIITHFDSDHFGEAEEILKEFTVKNLIIPDQKKTTKMYNVFMETLKAQPDIFLYVIEDNDDIDADIEVDDIIDIDDKNDRKLYVGQIDENVENDKGDLELEFFGPVNDSYNNSNDYSIIVMARWGNNKMLFTGDAEVKAEQAIIDEYGLELNDLLDCDIFKAGHHGSSTSSCKDVLDAASPEYIIISCGEDNSYGHPHTEAMQRFTNSVSEENIYRTDLQGDIIFITDGETITVKTQK